VNAGWLFQVLLAPALISAASAQSPSVIYNFNVYPGTSGLTPSAGKVFGVLPGVYGKARAAVFELTPPAASGDTWSESTIYHFGSGSPVSALAASKSGVLYGMTELDGANGAGTVYELAPPKAAGSPWIYTLLYSFSTAECPDYGCQPGGPPTIGSSGDVYVAATGTATDCGEIIKLTPPSQTGGGWAAEVLYTFTCQAGGEEPNGGMVIGAGGVLYGLARAGGGEGSTGLLFSLGPPNVSSPDWTFAILHLFNPGPFPPYSDGYTPVGGLTMSTAGVIYGTTEFGGTYGDGTVFEVVPPGNLPLQYEVIYNFTGMNGDGYDPWSAPVISANGSLYGTTPVGGNSSVGRFGGGMIYGLTPPAIQGGSWTESAMFEFGDGPAGAQPAAQLAIAPDGSLYGTDGHGGALGNGVAFRLLP
jgi:uncharacterized repeat protein (TIGR03803 family)